MSGFSHRENTPGKREKPSGMDMNRAQESEAMIRDFSQCASVLWASEEAIERAFLEDCDETLALMDMMRGLVRFERFVRESSLAIVVSTWSMGDLN